MIDRGSGTPVVLLPGVPGRWEWLQPAIDALAERCRVLTFSLCDEPTSGFRFDPRAGFDAYIQQIDEALQRAKVEKAVVIGVSYGGLIAAEFALRRPDRVLGLVLSSALPPGWTPDRRHRFYLRAPRLLSPLFFVAAPLVMLPELRAALGFRARLRFMSRACRLALHAHLSPSRMARRAGWIDGYEFADPGGIRVPALVITGEDRLDRIVRPELTRQYVSRLPNARGVTLERTGHLGLVTRPGEFADLVCRFIDEIPSDADRIPA